MKYIVVGAGAAGCVVAARLSEYPDNEVLLIEAGPDRDPKNRSSMLTSLNWIDAFDDAEAVDTQITASRVDGEPPRPYVRGIGVGGSGAINGMICLPGLSRDYDLWSADFGCRGWAWRDVEPWFLGMKPTLREAIPRQFTVIDSAMWRAAEDLGISVGIDTYGNDDGIGHAYLSASPTARRSTAQALLDRARTSSSITVLEGARVSHVIVTGGRARGVHLADGRLLEADHVVVCAGALESPAILLRSGLTHPGIGRNLRDHPSVRFDLSVPSEAPRRRAGEPSTNVVMRSSSSVGTGDLQLLPMFRQGAHGATVAGLLVAAMTVESAGEVTIDPANPLGPPRVQMNMLAAPRDVSALRDGVRLASRVLACHAFSGLAPDEGARDVMRKLQRDGSVSDDWIRDRTGDYFHASGTCRMGGEGDAEAVVDTHGCVLGLQGLHVIDASVFPQIPSANTYWPVVMVAERLTAGLMGRSLAEVPVWPVDDA